MCEAVMTDSEIITTRIYNTLLQLRYPAITKAELKDVESTILTGDNRISLLSWLLIEKSSHISSILEKLNGSLLEDELLKCYSEIGICTKKDLLLGNCAFNEQLPTLNLLLDFMKHVYMETSDATCDSNESVDEILKVLYIDNGTNSISSLRRVKTKVNLTDAVQYFANITNDLPEINKTSNNCKHEMKVGKIEMPYIQLQNADTNFNECDQNAQYNTEKNKFADLFSEIQSWPVSNSSYLENMLCRIDTDTKHIHSDISTLKTVSEAKDEISIISVPERLNKTTTPLTEVIKDTVLCIEEIQNLYMGEQIEY